MFGFSAGGAGAGEVLVLGKTHGEPVRKLSQEFQKIFDQARMSETVTFVNQLVDVKGVADGPTKVLEEMKELFKEFNDEMDKAARKPETLTPTGVNYEDWQREGIAQQLKILKQEFVTVAVVLDEMTKPLKKLADSVNGAADSLHTIVKKLSSISSKLARIADECQTSKDVTKIDVEGLNKILNTDPALLSGPLQMLAGLREPLARALVASDRCTETLVAFRARLAGLIKEAFIVPTVFSWLRVGCCARVSGEKEAPAMTILLRKVNTMHRLPLDRVKGGLSEVNKVVSSLPPDTTALTEPVVNFCTAGKPLLHKLEEYVKQEKNAARSNLGMSGM